MTNWLDFVIVGLVLIILGGVAFAVVTISGKIQDTVKSTKASLNDKGVNLTASGMLVKTNKSLDREAYLDATQRGMINAMKATSFGPTQPDGSRRSLSDIDKHIKQAPDSPLDHTTTKKRNIFGKKSANK